MAWFHLHCLPLSRLKLAVHSQLHVRSLFCFINFTFPCASSVRVVSSIFDWGVSYVLCYHWFLLFVFTLHVFFPL